MSKSFLYELSYLRGIAIFAVVIVHAIVIARWQLNWEAEMQITHMTLFFLAGLFRFALPVFIFISGFTFLTKYLSETSPYWEMLKSRCQRLLKPYALWTILGLICSFAAKKTFTVQSLLLAIFLGSGMFFQLYYIPLLFQFYLLAPVLKYALDDTPRGKLIMVLLLATNVAYYIFYQLYILNLLPPEYTFSNYVYYQVSFIPWMIYFLLGGYVGKNLTAFSQRIESCSIATLFFILLATFILQLGDAYLTFQYTHNFGTAHNTLRPSVILFSFAIIAFFYKFFRYDKLTKNFFLVLSKYSFGIYLSHLLFLFALLKISPKLFSNIPLLMITFCLTLGLCILLNLLTEKLAAKGLRWAKYVVGG